MQDTSEKKAVERSATIPKNPDLHESQDYAFLRQQAITWIEQMGSRYWTDYNTHDPGITILESICYGLTDLGYRTGWDIADILAEDAQQPVAEKQTFFTPREILVTAPLTVHDYRRLLMDIDSVKNAWLTPSGRATPKGIYDVVLELEQDPELGDLNERKFVQSITTELLEGNQAILNAEFRFPEWDSALWGNITDYCLEGVLQGSVAEASVEVFLFPREGTGTPAEQEEARTWKQWNRVFYATFHLTFQRKDGNQRNIIIADIPFRLSGSSAARAEFTLSRLTSPTIDWTELAVLYIRKTAHIRNILDGVKALLDQNRNLCEDFSYPSLVSIEEIGVCADIEITATADIELVLAEIIIQIERYFRPPVPFYTLDELLQKGKKVEEIFEGPPLKHGFLREEDLEKSGQKQHLRTSDIINKLMNIEGVDAITNFQMTRYDSHGLPVRGVSDSGQNPDQTSASWTMDISEGCQPGLTLENSRFVVFRNGLPFLARTDELQSTLNQLRGEKLQGKNLPATAQKLDLPIPGGRYRSPGTYWPLQYNLPTAYGTSPEGLREPSSQERKAQALQLKAYLMVFEQLLANSFAQLTNTANLFKLDASLTRSYFASHIADNRIITEAETITSDRLDLPVIEALLETTRQGVARRNRFLSHLLARFGETCHDMPLLVNDNDGSRLSPEELLPRIVSFLSRYPVLSRDRAQSFDYHANETQADDIRKVMQPVLREKIGVLLGLDEPATNEILVVEHLVLRPAFAGDAFLGYDTQKNCQADPYSFRITIVMPGWKEPYSSNMALRRFAERTIDQQVPAHLAAKTCWTGNSNYGDESRESLIERLAYLLREKGQNARHAKPPVIQTRNGATKIHSAAQKQFRAWIEQFPAGAVYPADRSQAIETLMQHILDNLASIYPGVKNYNEFSQEIQDLLVEHFMEVLEKNDWFLYDRFVKAWQTWLAAQSSIDRCNEEIAGLVRLWLQELPAPSPDVLTAERIITRFGEEFSIKMKQNVLEGKNFVHQEGILESEISNIFNTAFPLAQIMQVTVTSKQKDALLDIFILVYRDLADISMKHWDLVLLLEKLHNVYPVATLHDCNEGSDENPVRLNATALGTEETISQSTPE